MGTGPVRSGICRTGENRLNSTSGRAPVLFPSPSFFSRREKEKLEDFGPNTASRVQRLQKRPEGAREQGRKGGGRNEK
ncbi:hypothetical protein L345_11236, partial [Ophiophagus hannah]